MGAVLFYLRAGAILVWLGICSIFWMVISLFRWGNLNNNFIAARLFGTGALRIGGIRQRILGLEQLEANQPCIYVCNHQSALDVVNFGRIYPRRTIIIGKKELLWLPFFGLGFVAAGNVLINRRNKRHSIGGLGRAVERLRTRGASIFIFPEGTRNRAGEGLLPFKKGAFHMAIEAGVPVVPLVCSPLKDRVDPASGRTIRGTVTLKVLPPIPTQRPEGRLTIQDVDQLKEETRQRMLEALHGLTDPSLP